MILPNSSSLVTLYTFKKKNFRSLCDAQCSNLDQWSFYLIPLCCYPLPNILYTTRPSKQPLHRCVFQQLYIYLNGYIIAQYQLNNNLNTKSFVLNCDNTIQISSEIRSTPLLHTNQTNMVPIICAPQFHVIIQWVTQIKQTWVPIISAPEYHAMTWFHIQVWGTEK